MDIKDFYSAHELAEMKIDLLPKTKKGVIDKATREKWLKQKRPGRGGGFEYIPPKSVTELIKKKYDDKVLDKVFYEQKQLPVTVIQEEVKIPIIAKGGNKVGKVIRADGAMVKRGLIRRVKTEEKLNDSDRTRRDAGLILCQAIESAMTLSNCSARRAINELAERILNGVARPELIDASTVTYTKPRKTGQTQAALVSRLQKMYAAYNQGHSEGDIGRYLVPGKVEKKGYDPIHIHAFMIFYCRPTRPPIKEAWRAAQGWFAAQSLPCPAVDTFYRIEKFLPVTIKYRGRMTGSEWRGLKAYVARDVSMFHTNDIWVADGHSFKAKVQHPVHGQPFTPEITIVIDWVSRRIVGWSVDLSESTIAVSAALRHAEQQTRARPLVFYSDNGSGECGKLIDCPIHGTLARQGITHETGIPGNPQARGIIERLWQVTTIPMARTYPTCTWKGADKEATRKMLVALMKKDGTGQEILPTWKQLLDDCEKWLGWNGEYNRLHAHSALEGRTPAEEYVLKIEPGAELCGPTDDELAVLWMPEVGRIPQRGVISIFNNEYANKMLVDALSEGEKVRVRFDIHDANQVWVLRMDGTFLCVAQWDAHKKAAWPVPYMDKKRQDRVDDKIKRAKRDIKEANAELGNVIEEKGEFVKNITDFIDVTASIPKICELTVADFRDEPAEIEKEASYLDTMMWINGEGADPRSKKLAAG
jgi:putative transposase